MGWTSPKDKPDDVARYLDLYFSGPTKGGIHKVIRSAIVCFSTYYAAIEKTDLEGNKTTYAVVCLLQYGKDPYGFRHKDMNEAEYPYQADCPEKILDLLSPTDNVAANKWRDACRSKIANRTKNRQLLKDGNKIKFDKPIRFSNRRTLDTFTVLRHARRTRLKGPDGLLYHVPDLLNRNMELVA